MDCWTQFILLNENKHDGRFLPSAPHSCPLLLRCKHKFFVTAMNCYVSNHMDACRISCFHSFFKYLIDKFHSQDKIIGIIFFPCSYKRSTFPLTFLFILCYIFHCLICHYTDSLLQTSADRLSTDPYTFEPTRASDRVTSIWLGEAAGLGRAGSAKV